jgi:hypothetical protein
MLTSTTACRVVPRWGSPVWGQAAHNARHRDTASAGQVCRVSAQGSAVFSLQLEATTMSNNVSLSALTLSESRSG